MKGETTFTRGPWGNEDADNQFLVTAGRDKRGAYIYVADCGWGGAGVSEEEEAGNLALVKAAPTLLTRLTEARDMLQRWADSNECDCTMDGGAHTCGLPRLRRLIEDCDAALAVALPESSDG